MSQALRSPTLVFLAATIVLSTPAAPQSFAGGEGRIEWELREAKTADQLEEAQVAESHRRAAAREIYTRLGAIAIADGDLKTAERALYRARHVAASDLETARELLATVELHLAFRQPDAEDDVEASLRELRFGVNGRPEDAAALSRFAKALWATGRNEEFRAELETLRALDSAAATELERLAESEEPRLSPPDPGEVGEWSADQRSAAAMHLRELVAQIETALAAERPAELRLSETFAPPSLDPARLLAQMPESLHSVLDLLDRGDRVAALAQLRAEVDGPDGPAARRLLGQLLAAGGDPENAEAELAHAIRIDPEPGLAQQALARLYGSTGRRDEAITLLRQAAFEGDLERDLARILAEAEIAQERWPEAREQLETLHKRFDSAAALLRLVDVARAEQAPKRAFDAAERALGLAPNSERALYAHARQALEIEVPSSAARSVEALARMRPEVAEYQFLLGEVWRQKRQMGAATEAYLQALSIEPEFTAALKPLGLALNHETRFAEGRDVLSRFLEQNPRDLDALAGLAEAEERLGEADQAEARAQEILALDAAHARARLVLGMVATGRGEFAAARSLFEKVVEIDPWLAKAHYQLSFACARLRDRECAKRHLDLYRRALEGPESTFGQLQAQAPLESAPSQMTREGGP